VMEMFGAHGIGAERVEMRHPQPNLIEHLNTYADIDIALDSFPYNGTTMNCEAMWMGVPVVTLAGTSHVSRVGASLLHRVGLDELVAQTPEQYVTIASALAGDVHRLGQIRESLRDRMRERLTNAPRFIIEYENALRTIWQTFCEAP